jgi:hypothetical protein
VQEGAGAFDHLGGRGFVVRRQRAVGEQVLVAQVDEQFGDIAAGGLDQLTPPADRPLVAPEAPYVARRSPLGAAAARTRRDPDAPFLA